MNIQARLSSHMHVVPNLKITYICCKLTNWVSWTLICTMTIFIIFSDIDFVILTTYFYFSAMYISFVQDMAVSYVFPSVQVVWTIYLIMGNDILLYCWEIGHFGRIYLKIIKFHIWHEAWRLAWYAFQMHTCYLTYSVFVSL